MSTWDDYRQQARITFSTPAPPDAPETKGTRCWFKPEWLDWTVTKDVIHVVARGPATRVPHRQGEAAYCVEGARRGDERPTWLLLPIDVLTAATLAARDIERHRRTLTEGDTHD